MIEQIVRTLYSLLCNGRYEELANMTRAERLRGPEIEAAIREYGCKLVDYPESINLDVIEVQGGECRQWNIVAPIYTAEEGISDLGMELTVYESGDASKIALENIRVR